MSRSPHDHRDLEAETNKKQEIHVLLLFTLGLGNMSRMEGKMSILFHLSFCLFHKDEVVPTGTHLPPSCQ